MNNVINNFLVEVFNEILKAEERSLNKGYKDLSVKEMHVIEAVCDEEKEKHNIASLLAKKLKVTAGTLTTAVSLLEKKGYLVREKDAHDRRVVRITPTENGRKAGAYHKAFHEKMVGDILKRLTDEETAVMVKALGNLTDFFRGEYGKEIKNG